MIAYNESNNHVAFVGREDFLNYLCHEWDLFTLDKHTHSGFFLYAIAGMGKTWALRTLYYRICATDQPIIWLRILEREEPSPPLPPVPRDLNDQAHACLVSRQCHLRAGLAEVGEFLGIRETWANLLPELDTYDLEFTLPHMWQRDSKIAICVDGIDLLERYEPDSQAAALPIGGMSLWENLQEKWLQPVLNTNHCFILLTGQGKPIWINWELGRLIKAERLTQLGSNEVRQLLHAYDLEGSAKTFYHLSKGHPASVVYLAQNVSERSLPAKIRSSQKVSCVELPTETTFLGRLHEQDPIIYTALLNLAPIRTLDMPIAKHFSSLTSKNIASLRNQGIIKIYYNRLFSMGIDPILRVWLLEERQKDIAGLIKQYLEIISYYKNIITSDPLRGIEASIEWIYASLQYQLLAGWTQDEQFRINWFQDFEKIRDMVPNPEFYYAIQEDSDIWSSLIDLGYDRIIKQILSVINFEQYKEQTRGNLDTFIQKRIPGQLTVQDWLLLRELSRLGRSFKIKDVQDILGRLSQQTDISRLSALSKIRMLNTVYVTEKSEGGYIVDDWLQEYFKSDEH